MRLLVSMAFMISLSHPAVAATTFDHSACDQLLRRYVSPAGLVAYEALHSPIAWRRLDAYVDSLARYSPDSQTVLLPEHDHALAYWINAYNAFVLRRVVDAYPITSVGDTFLFNGFFNRQEFFAGGRKLTSNNVEIDTIRPRDRATELPVSTSRSIVSQSTVPFSKIGYSRVAP